VAELKVRTLKSAQFATAFAGRPQQFAWFLGAGASASAGIPTGTMMIRDFKTRLFCQETALPRCEVDSTDPLWVQRIAEFFQKRSLLPPAGDPSEYSAAFEAVFPTHGDRRRYIEDAIRKGTPSFGHRVLASLVTVRHIPCIFTTNFDPLIEIASTQTDQLLSAGDRAMPTVAALDSVDRAERCLRESAWPLIAKLHGDYQSTMLKNTSTELKEQDGKMRAVLTNACQRFGLVVAGYSGRDGSVMAALEHALQIPGAFPSGIYWVTKSEHDVFPAVRLLLQKAVQAGVDAAIVESKNFDELAADLANQFILPDILRRHVFEARPRPVLRPVPLPSGDSLKFPILRCSALLIDRMPPEARRFVLARAASTVEVRDLLREAKVHAVVASTGREVAAFGIDEMLVKALAPLGARLAGTIQLNLDADSWAVGLLYDALTRALCRRRPLRPRMRRAGHAVLVKQGITGEDDARPRERRILLDRLLAAYGSPLHGTVPELGYPFSEGVRLRLEQCADRWWCVFDPFTFVEVPRIQEVPDQGDDPDRVAAIGFQRGDPAGDWRRERWAQKYNTAWAKIIDGWAHLLASSDDSTIKACGVPEGEGVDAVFGLSSVTAWSRPAHQHEYFERRR
jgi:SIR2-like domain